ncbi:MAG: 3-deoxy-manno-octulosonate cytidylyltransferase [Balneolales bacterium]|nr:3-deoxy-manno-octulosonate cytidylyltransferase [Balneolales bacterium]
MYSIIIIPARMKSSRLPGKPLVDILGKSLLQRTWEQSCKAFPKERVYVATDHPEIQKHCKELGIQVVMTSDTCLTGTDRVAEVANQIEADYYINVQGDEPLINPQDILDVEEAIKKYSGEIINGYAEIDDAEMWSSVSTPKVVCRQDGRLLYMSRAAIPGNKSGKFEKGWRQVCVYAYPKEALDIFYKTKSKTELEELEDLEILRFLEMGYEVRMVKLSSDSIAVDHPGDVEKVIRRLNENN